MNNSEQEALLVPIWHESKVSAAGMLGIGRSLAYQLVSEGVIPSVALGGRRLVPVAQLRKVIEELTEDQGAHQEPYPWEKSEGQR